MCIRDSYITLAPIATVLGLAFKLSDPEKLLGGAEDFGITDVYKRQVSRSPC